MDMALRIGIGLPFAVTITGAGMAWTRPSDWLPMPTTAANQIDVLTAVTNDDSNYCALSCTVSAGTYDVDWGDGTSNTGVTSGATVEHQYSYADTDLDGTLTTRGYKQALIQITPNTGGANITAFDLGKKHTRTSLNAYTNLWLDIQVNVPSCTSMTYRGSVESRVVERIDIKAIGSVTTLFQAFTNCYSLQSISFPSGSLASVTTLQQAFYGCNSLQSISFPSGSLASVTTLYLAFYNCNSLQSISFPSVSLASVTTLQQAFTNCYSLQSISFPSGSLASVTMLFQAFYNCNSLQSISFPSGSLASVTSLQQAFDGCNSLQSISFPSGSLGLVTTTTDAFLSCSSLAKIENCAIPVSFSIASCKFAGTELDEIYTALPSASATITVSTNHGNADDDPSIATGKGWTVVGS